jgi:methylglutaconyl-CoA hydratase
MSMSTSLLIERQGRVLHLTLNRPEKRNALNMELCRALLDAFHEGSENPSIGAMLLDGTGPSFCSGMDLSEVLGADQETLLPLHSELFSIGTRLRKPLVAAVHGSILAGGLGLALNAHVVIAATDALFSLTEIRIGLWPCVIFPAVAAAVGRRKAVELALSARTFDASEAREIGIADHLVESGELAAKAFEIATGMASHGADAVSDGLEYVCRFEGLDATAERELAIEYRRRSFVSGDFREGVAAFLEKRRPVWPSHRMGS